MIPEKEPNGETENQLVADALKYAKSGLLVFPLHTVKDGKCTCGKNDCNSPAKHPRTAQGLKQASKDLIFVKNLFSSFTYASANIAVRRSARTEFSFPALIHKSERVSNPKFRRLL